MNYKKEKKERERKKEKNKKNGVLSIKITPKYCIK